MMVSHHIASVGSVPSDSSEYESTYFCYYRLYYFFNLYLALQSLWDRVFQAIFSSYVPESIAYWCLLNDRQNQILSCSNGKALQTGGSFDQQSVQENALPLNPDRFFSLSRISFSMEILSRGSSNQTKKSCRHIKMHKSKIKEIKRRCNGNLKVQFHYLSSRVAE